MLHGGSILVIINYTTPLNLYRPEVNSAFSADYNYPGHAYKNNNIQCDVIFYVSVQVSRCARSDRVNREPPEPAACLRQHVGGDACARVPVPRSRFVSKSIIMMS